MSSINKISNLNFMKNIIKLSALLIYVSRTDNDGFYLFSNLFVATPVSSL